MVTSFYQQLLGALSDAQPSAIDNNAIGKNVRDKYN